MVGADGATLPNPCMTAGFGSAECWLIMEISLTIDMFEKSKKQVVV